MAKVGSCRQLLKKVLQASLDLLELHLLLSTNWNLTCLIFCEVGDEDARGMQSTSVSNKVYFFIEEVLLRKSSTVSLKAALYISNHA